MNKPLKSLLLLLSLLIIVQCSNKNDKNTHSLGFSLVDEQATTETQALYYNLKILSNNNILFGHQDATAYGIGWKNEDLRSDINDVCGMFPAIYGWDLGKIGRSVNIDSVNFDRIKFWIKSAYERGGINTISWHVDNPASGGSAWDTIKAVSEILPGGGKHEFYINQLNLVADFMLDLKSKNGNLIPVIFRPFHEHNGNWFWWGRNHCTADEYIELYRYTIKYLRDTRQVHNLLYAYSPDVFNSEDNYMERFPGKDYVDVLGFDDYADYRSRTTIPKAIEQLKILVKIAQKMNKLAALTETGVNGIPDSTWWTECLLNPIKSDSVTKKISWILVWRNYSKSHHFAPYPGQGSVKDFIKFENDPVTMFEGDLPNMYEIK